MLAAGTDTTANTVAWVLHVLGGRPDLRTRVEAEVDAVVGDRPVTVADVRRLSENPEIRRMISEALRLYPQAWMLMRMTTVPVRLGAIQLLPAGAPLLLPLYALHRDPAVYPDPTDFDPDRWSADRTTDAMRPSFVPFGGGRHLCIGEAFAWTEAAILLAVVARELAPATCAGPYGGHQVTVHIEANPATDDPVSAYIDQWPPIAEIVWPRRWVHRGPLGPHEFRRDTPHGSNTCRSGIAKLSACPPTPRLALRLTGPRSRSWRRC